MATVSLEEATGATFRRCAAWKILYWNPLSMAASDRGKISVCRREYKRERRSFFSNSSSDYGIMDSLIMRGVGFGSLLTRWPSGGKKRRSKASLECTTMTPIGSCQNGQPLPHSPAPSSPGKRNSSSSAASAISSLSLSQQGKVLAIFATKSGKLSC